MARNLQHILSSLGTTLAVLSASSCAVGQSDGGFPSPSIKGDGGSGSGGGSEFGYYFSVTTDPWEYNHGRRYSDQLRFDTGVLSRDMVILYQHRTGLYPMAGPHLSADPAYMQAHLEELVRDVAEQIPDPNFSGIAILDYESFPAVWDRVWNTPSDKGPEYRDDDFRDDWTDHIRSVHAGFDAMSETEQQDLLRETWEAAVADLFTQSINTARSVRPKAKWGFYGYPYRFFKHRREAPENVISYGGGHYHGSELNDRLQWMWDAVDIVTPSIYALRPVGEPTDECQDYCTAAEDLAYVTNMIQEARRVANGKPVLPFVATIYAARRGCEYLQTLNDDSLYGQIVGPALAGADGVLLWGHILTAEERDQWQQQLDQRILPLMEQGLAHRNDAGGRGAQDGDGDAGGSATDETVTPPGGVKTSRNSRGVVSREADVPTDAGAATTRRLPSVRFNPATDRLSTTKAEPVKAAKAGAIRVPSRKVKPVPAVRYTPGEDRISKPPVGSGAKKSTASKGQGES